MFKNLLEIESVLWLKMLHHKQRYGLLAKTLNLEISSLSFERLFQRNMFEMRIWIV